VARDSSTMTRCIAFKLHVHRMVHWLDPANCNLANTEVATVFLDADCGKPQGNETEPLCGNPKSEYLNPKQAQISKALMFSLGDALRRKPTGIRPVFGIFVIRASDPFGDAQDKFVWNLEFSASSFPAFRIVCVYLRFSC